MIFIRKDDKHQFLMKHTTYPMKRILFTCFNIFSVLFIACTVSRTLSEGITGKILWFEGDLMPGINKEPVEGIPLKRDIYIFMPTHTDQLEVINHVFYQNIQTRLIKRVTSDEKGNFSVKLKPGLYSLFVEEPTGLFANRYDEYGYVNTVKVNENKVTDIVIRIDYMAAY